MLLFLSHQDDSHIEKQSGNHHPLCFSIYKSPPKAEGMSKNHDLIVIKKAHHMVTLTSFSSSSLSQRKSASSTV